MERIVFHGRVNNVEDYYRNADLLVVPSLFEEPAANVVLEAKCYGVPSIVYPSGGLPELVIDRVNGFVCYEKTVLALTQGIRWLIEKPERIPSMKIAAIEDSENRFGIERFARQWADVYSNSTNINNQ